MEKDRFLILAQNFTSLSEEEASELIALQKEYPYSQIIHNLTARAALDNQLQNYNQLLNLSAVYSTDRSVLKYIMTEPKGKREVTPATTYFTASEITPSDGHLFHGDDLIHEIEIDLAKLKELKHNFELSLDEYEREHQVMPEEKPKAKKAKASVVHQDDGLIEEIKTKKEIDLGGEKQKEQIQIIDNFIKTSPSIPKGKLATAVSGDLAENSSAFTDNIVSETLVGILIKQGKKDKAIEVLRKLIWKFPQKKAIFATQIEELKG